MAALVIKPSSSFSHAGDIDSPGLVDPRIPDSASDLFIDLEDCGFVRPAGLLWCAITSIMTIKAGRRVQVRPPSNMGVRNWWAATKISEVLKSFGVNVEEPELPRGVSDPQIAIPISHFNDTDDVDNLLVEAFERIEEAGLGAPNVRTTAVDVFAELAYNAVQHSNTPIGALGMVQLYQFADGPRFVCIVAEGGIGIKASLAQNPSLAEQLTSDRGAIRLALNDHVSGTGEPTRGLGLPFVAKMARVPRGQMIIHSGIGMLDLIGTDTYRLEDTTIFPGTLAFAGIPT